MLNAVIFIRTSQNRSNSNNKIYRAVFIILSNCNYTPSDKILESSPIWVKIMGFTILYF